MHKLSRILIAALVLSCLLASSSALAAHGMRNATSRAARHSGHQGRFRRHARRKPGTAIHPLIAQGTALSSSQVLLGDTRVESQYDSLVPGQAEAFRIQATATGVAALAQVYLRPGNTASTIIAGLYSNAAGRPGSLLSTGSATAFTAGAWTAVPIAPVELVANRVYWLAILGNGGPLRYLDRREGPCPSETSAQTNLRGLPGSWRGSTRYTDCPASAYVSSAPALMPEPAVGPELPPPEAPAPSEEPTPPARPVNITQPAISGSATEGGVLGASSGTWTGSPTSYAYQWQDCTASGTRCANVAGATGSSYSPTAGDVGHTLRVLVSASNAGGATSASSEASEVVSAQAPAAPTNTALPAISGTALLGESLSASTGAWSESPSSYSYRWQECNAVGGGCTNIAGATASSLALVAGEVGHALRVVVTATNAGGSTPATSAATAAVLPLAPVSTAPPSISGLAAEGETLTAGNGSWTEGPASFAYQWQDCNATGDSCSAIAGASSATYKPVGHDVGHALRVLVTATNAGGSGTASSPATAAVLPHAPTNTAPPTVTGSLIQGETLSASTGAWSGSPTSFSYRWQQCNSVGGGCANISGATASTYKLASGDVGHTLRVVVTASNAGGSTPASSAATGVVAPPAPVNKTLPSVSGSAVEGEALRASQGTWSGNPTSFAYQWQDCNSAGASCTNVSGATGATYVLGAGDVGSTVRVMVTASNAGGSTAASSAVTTTVLAGSLPPEVPTNVEAPAVAGQVVEGHTLSASAGAWTGAPTSFAYQWQDCNSSGEACVNVSGATAATYVLSAGDVGSTIRVAVTASNAQGSGSASSTATATVAAAPPAAPTNTLVPSVSGSATEGETLTASNGTWTGSPTSYTYQWQDCDAQGEGCLEVSGATGTSYTLATSDVGHTIRVLVTAANAGGATSASSPATATVMPLAPTNTAPPTISGAAIEGQTLSANSGTWSGTTSMLEYQWQDCNALGEGCLNIPGATASSYAPTASDVGSTIRVVVTASNAGGSTAASSEATATVVPSAPVNTVLPAISGSDVEGQTLSATQGSWLNGPTSFGFQWQDCNSSGGACASISGATSSSYKLASGDVGHTLRVVVSASNAGGSTQAGSAASAVVVPPAPVNTALPVVSGSDVEGQTLSASQGTWSNSPTSYAYQWQDCNASGGGCVNISGATSSSDKLTSGDVGHTVRVVVTASNAGGSIPASSAATAIVAAEASGMLVGSSAVQASGDTESAGSAEAFEYTASTTGTVHSLSLYVNTGNTASTIMVGLYSNVSGAPGTLLSSATITSPTSGAWHAVGVPAVAVSSGTAYWLAALAPSGTLALRDVGSGGGPARSSSSNSLKELPASWSSGASWASAPASFYASGETVALPAAPTNTALPTISGSAVEGETLSASTGTWTESPTSYGYQWRDCNSSGESCANVSGATSSSYKLVAGDVGHKVRVVVSASNAGGSTPASSAATSAVAAAPPSAPVNTVAPEVSGSAVEGQTLAATSGTWSGNPTSFAYQWQDCNSEGASCSNIGAATSPSYTLAANDVGHTVRIAVTASNASGATQATSAATAVVIKEEEGEAFACSIEIAESEAGKLAEKIASMPTGGGTVCLKSGTFPYTEIKSSNSHTGYVVVRPAKGATVIDKGFHITKSSYIAIEHFSSPSLMTEGVFVSQSSAPASKNLRVNYDVIEDPSCNHGLGCPEPQYGLYLGGTGTGGPNENVQFDHDFVRHVNLGGSREETECKDGISRGQDVTMEWSTNVEIAHDVFDEAEWHYIQDGNNATVEDNLFLGYDVIGDAVCGAGKGAHLNLWQMWAGGEHNNVFRGNIAVGKEEGQEKGAATDGLLAENGPGGSECSRYVSGLTVENNLLVNAGESFAMQTYYNPLTVYRHNSVVYSNYGTGVGLQDGPSGGPKCLSGEAEITNNIGVETYGKGAAMSLGCTGMPCLVNENVADDASVKGESTKVEKWKESWESSASCPPPSPGCWNPYREIEEGVRFPAPPKGYYVPKGLPFKAGYEGTGGP